jgi:hypothetical protein
LPILDPSKKSTSATKLPPISPDSSARGYKGPGQLGSITAYNSKHSKGTDDDIELALRLQREEEELER